MSSWSVVQATCYREAMITVTMSPDCGNAPKQAYIRDVLTSAARGERAAVAQAVADDWTYRVAGRPPATGEAAIDELIAEMSPPGLESLAITALMSHGKLAAASGWLLGKGTRTEFCCMLTFTGHTKTARIADCVTYLVMT